MTLALNRARFAAAVTGSVNCPALESPTRTTVPRGLATCQVQAAGVLEPRGKTESHPSRTSAWGARWASQSRMVCALRRSTCAAPRSVTEPIAAAAKHRPANAEALRWNRFLVRIGFSTYRYES